MSPDVLRLILGVDKDDSLRDVSLDMEGALGDLRQVQK